MILNGRVVAEDLISTSPQDIEQLPVPIRQYSWKYASLSDCDIDALSIFTRYDHHIIRLNRRSIILKHGPPAHWLLRFVASILVPVLELTSGSNSVAMCHLVIIKVFAVFYRKIFPSMYFASTYCEYESSHVVP